jgi:hypothetical protein
VVPVGTCSWISVVYNRCSRRARHACSIPYLKYPAVAPSKRGTGGGSVGRRRTAPTAICANTDSSDASNNRLHA